MKNLLKFTLTIIGFLLLTLQLSAQTVGKGAWMVGGSAGFSIQKFKDADASTSFIGLNPNLGYFIGDDLAIGLSINFNSTSFDGNSSSTFGVGPFVRYYVADPIFIQVGANLGLDEGAGTTIGASVGYSWFLNDGLAIEPALFFNITNNDGDVLDYSVFGLSIGVQGFANHDHGME